MKRQKLGKKYWFDLNEPKGWFKKFVTRETRLFLKRQTQKEFKRKQALERLLYVLELEKEVLNGTSN